MVDLMRTIRRQVARIAVGWLLCHACLLVSIPTVICHASQAELAAECTCEHGDGQMCPMHHTRSRPKGAAAEAPSCSCRSTADPMIGLAASLVGPPAITVPAMLPHAPMPAATESPLLEPVVLEAPLVPDSPPPRA